MILSILLLSCKKNSDIEQVSNYVDLRTMEQELAFVKSKANSLTKNSKGYWEADFGKGLVFIYVPKDRFTMGNNVLSSNVVTGSYPSAPEHQVSLSHYWIAKTAVTIGQFRAFVQATNYVSDVEKSGNEVPYVYDFSSHSFRPQKGYNWSNAYKNILAKILQITINDKHPVSCVSWNDAIAYCNWLAEQKGGDWSSSAGRANQIPNELSEGHNIRAEGRSGDAKNSADDHLGFRIAISYTVRN